MTPGRRGSGKRLAGTRHEPLARADGERVPQPDRLRRYNAEGPVMGLERRGDIVWLYRWVNP